MSDKQTRKGGEMEEFIDDFCYTLARIIEIEEKENETNEKD